MIEWKQIDNYHLRLGDWTISKALNVPLPYALWNKYKSHGFFKTLDEAKAKYESIKK